MTVWLRFESDADAARDVWLSIPEAVEGLSMLGDEQRELLYGEFGEKSYSSRMVRDARYKLIWYPCDNHFQLFDFRKIPMD